MSSKLDQSLDEIAGSRRTTARRQRSGKPRVSTGGVTKNTAQRAAKPAKAAPPAPRPVPNTGESKIIVSNLPSDVTEENLKDYFKATIGPVKRAILTYNKTGRSIGIATIIFQHATSAAQAAKQLDTVKVDGRPMKIEVILGAQFAPAPVAPKSLGERISQPKKEAGKAKAKPQPKSAATPKPATGAKDAAGAGKGRGKRAARPGRPKPKSVEELDAEMSEYFEPGAGGDVAANTNGAAPAATNGGDAAMVDEVL